MGSNELEEAQELLERGELKQALKRIDLARKKALGAQDAELMRTIFSAAEALDAQTDGRLGKASGEQVSLAKQNLIFLTKSAEGHIRTNAEAVAGLNAETASDSSPGAEGDSGLGPDETGSFTARGRNGQLTVTPTKIIISRKGAMGFMTQGHKGEKEIDLHQLSAVQFKKNGLATAGYIQFSFMGGSETKQGLRDAVNDENSIVFKKSQEAAFIRAKELLDEYRAALRAPVAPAPKATEASLADELEKLASLRDKGILDEEEFKAQKRKLLGL